MARTLYSFTDAGEVDGQTYDVFVVGFDTGPFHVDRVTIKGMGTRRGPEVGWDSVASAMASGHAFARKLIED
jgi:hypothetical protein